MTKKELLKAIQHVSAYYNLFFSTIDEDPFMVSHLYNLAAIMWILEYPEDNYSDKIRIQLKNLSKYNRIILDD